MKEEPKITPMKSDDLNFVLSLADKTPQLWLDDEEKFPFDREDIINWMGDRDKRAYTFKREDDKIGFCLVKLDRETAEIESFVIDEDYRGKGFGKQLFEKLLEKLERQDIEVEYLYVGPENEKAINLYRKLGFKEGRELLIMYRGIENKKE